MSWDFNGPIALRPDEAEYPTLWDGIVGAWMPSLGIRGTASYDLTPYANHGVLTGLTIASAWNVQKGIGSITYSGSAYNAIPAVQNVVGGAAQATISGWFYRSATGIMQIHGWENGFDSRFCLLWFSNGVLYACVSNDATQAYTAITYDAVGWANWTLVFDSSGATSADKAKLYLNGALAASSPNGTFTTLASAANLGALTDGRSGGRGQTSAGSLGDMFLWNRALTPNEVAILGTEQAALVRPARRGPQQIPQEPPPEPGPGGKVDPGAQSRMFSMLAGL